MSDKDIRDLQRRWLVGQNIEDGEAWVRAVLRTTGTPILPIISICIQNAWALESIYHACALPPEDRSRDGLRIDIPTAIRAALSRAVTPDDMVAFIEGRDDWRRGPLSVLDPPTPFVPPPQGYIPMATPVDLIHRMEQDVINTLRIPEHLLLTPAPEGNNFATVEALPANTTCAVAVGAIDYVTGAFTIHPELGESRWVFDYDYVTRGTSGDDVIDRVTNDHQERAPGRLNYSPVRPGSIVAETPFADAENLWMRLRDDEHGNLVLREVFRFQPPLT